MFGKLIIIKKKKKAGPRGGNFLNSLMWLPAFTELASDQHGLILLFPISDELSTLCCCWFRRQCFHGFPSPARGVHRCSPTVGRAPPITGLLGPSFRALQGLALWIHSFLGAVQTLQRRLVEEGRASGPIPHHDVRASARAAICSEEQASRRPLGSSAVSNLLEASGKVTWPRWPSAFPLPEWGAWTT